MLNIKSLLFLPFILIYIMPTCGVVLSDNRKIFLSVFIIPIIFFILYILKTKSINKQLKLIYRKTPLKYFMYLYMWLIITGIIAVIKGYYSFNYFLTAVIIGFFFRGFLIYFYPMMVFPKYIKLRTLIKFFIAAIYIMLAVGVIEFIASVLNMQFVLNIIHILSNASNSDEVIIEAHSAIPRIKALLSEPGALADFIAGCLPFICNLSACRYRIFNNKFIDIFIKKTIIPISIFCLIMTQSPIGLLFAVAMAFYVYHEKIFCIIKKYFTIILIPVICILLIVLVTNMSGLDVSGSFLIRIVNVVGSMISGSFDEFINVEPSLATRVINWINQIQLWLRHPIIGIGFLNRGWVLYSHLQNSALPQTFEIKQNLSNYSGLMLVNMTMTTQLLYQTGIVGFVLYIRYMLKNIKYLSAVSQYFYGLEKIFIISFTQYMMYLFIKPFLYGPGFMNPLAFCAMGITNGLIILALNNREKYTVAVNSNKNSTE